MGSTIAHLKTAFSSVPNKLMSRTADSFVDVVRCRFTKTFSFLAEKATLMFGIFNRTTLTDKQKKEWDDNGYLILREFVSKNTIDDVNREVERIIDGEVLYPDVTIDVLAGPHGGRRFKLSNAPSDAFSAPVKINDLFIESDAIRSCNIGKMLANVLRDLLDGDPLVGNSLNFLYGSTQPAHYDSWFMPPSVENKMLATSICLDDVSETNGPVFLYPGSHKIPPFRFPHGGIAKLDADLQPAIDYAQETTKNITPIKFLGSPGDVLIWHGQLLHGGSQIEDRSKTRRTLVTHYFRSVDTNKIHRRKIAPGAYVMNRSHPHVH